MRSRRHHGLAALATVMTLACEAPASEALAVTAHGASLASHPAVRPGPCEP